MRVAATDAARKDLSWITQPLKIIHDGFTGQFFYILKTAARRQLRREIFCPLVIITLLL